ncbi:hypothetical protein [Streptomyces sp. Je 1-369]|uniref:hypothetical protein n=1 Tax=Streptomyces sp. Je 1-369 TaxID=2966192 RepID=UPI00228671E1|nr:hypothetical protein [Streptomyces sp. Je 1-369]WAL98475.1 hypothetical protein NOO62_30710 [Streptomyces sp. Je 1-369]
MNGVELNARPAGGLLVATTDFGWGSVGKLRLILDELDGVDLVVDDASDTARLAAQVIGGRHRFVHGAGGASPGAALVVNDPASADRIARSGTPVVYVDSLPYLWTVDAEVPVAATVYCAQRSLARELPPTSPLRGRADVRWVEPIVPPPRRRTGGAGAVINVGGLHSHLVGGASDAYLRAVVVPLVGALRRGGRRIAAVCGNLPPWVRTELAAVLPRGVHVGPLRAYEFEAALLRADALFTSPGSTTILQAASLGLPTVLLPPQNLSQILNAEIFGAPGRGVIPWPESVIDRDLVDALRPEGEDAVLGYVYRRIGERCGDPAVRALLVERFRALVELPTAAVPDGLSPRLRELGHGGARQVARIIRRTLRSCAARGRRG